MIRRPVSATLSAAAVAATVLGLAGPGLAADGDPGRVEVTNTETVLAYTDAAGSVTSKSLVEQLMLTGTGRANVRNPVVSDGLRNLDGFGGVTVKNGQQVISTTVDGEKDYRSVSDYDGKLPLDISVTYQLDGKPVKPSDLVGRSGALAVEYTVKNVTGRSQDVTYDDGQGGTVTKSVQVVVPMVGSLTTTLPPRSATSPPPQRAWPATAPERPRSPSLLPWSRPSAPTPPPSATPPISRTAPSPGPT